MSLPAPPQKIGPWQALSLLFIAGIVLFFLMGMVRPAIVVPITSLIGYNEGWNAGFAARLLAGEPLYPEAGALITNNYPPVSFLLLAAIGSTGADLIYSGRIVNLLGFFSSALLIFLIARRLGCGVKAAALGALILLATIARFFPYYIGMNEPQWLAHAAMLLSLGLLLGAKTRRQIAGAMAIMLAAGLIKHNLIAAPLGAFAYLALYDRPKLKTAFSAALVIGGFYLALIQVFFGNAFWHNLINPRILTLDHFLHKLEHILAVIAPLGAWLFAMIRYPDLRQRQEATLVACLLAGAAFEIFLFAAGDGVAANIVFDLVIMASLAVALTADHFLKTARTGLFCLFTFLLLVQIAAWPTTKYLKAAYSAEERTRLHNLSASLDRTIGALKSVPGNAWCDHPNLCYWAGKPLTFDHFNVFQRVELGRMSREELMEAFEKADVRALQFDHADPVADNRSLLVPLIGDMKDITPSDGFGRVFARP